MDQSGRSPVPDKSPERKNVSPRTRRVAVQTRGERGADELVAIALPGGKEKLTRVPHDVLREIEGQTDRDFGRAIKAVTAGEGLDKKALTDLIESNKDSILALARKEGDVHKAIYLAMEDVVDVAKEYDRLTEQAVADSGYTGIAADGLRDTLLKERSSLFSEALRQSAGPRAKRNLENAIRGKLLAEATKQVVALEKLIGEPEVEVEDPLVEIQANIQRLEALSAKSHTDARKDLAKAINDLDRAIQKDSAEWVQGYFAENPDATREQMMAQVEALGLSEFVTQKDVERIMRGMRVEELHAQTGRTEAGLMSRRRAAERVRGLASVEAAEDMPASVPADEWASRKTSLFAPRPGGKTLVPGMDDTLVPSAEEIPDVTDHLREERPAKKGFLQGLAKNGRQIMLGMALLFGMKAASPDQRLPHHEGMVANPEGMVTALSEEAKIEQAVAPTEKIDQTTAPTEKQVEAKRLVLKTGDPKNLEVALDALSVFPGKAEFERMPAREKAAQTKAALEDFKVIRAALSKRSPAIDAAKLQTLKAKLEDAQSRWELLRTIRDL